MKAGNAYSIGVSGVIVVGLGGYLVMNDSLTVGFIAVLLVRTKIYRARFENYYAIGKCVVNRPFDVLS